jgi:nucleoside-diphosphate kinase
MDNKDLEQTLVLIKPDALKNSLTGYVLSQLSEFHTGLRYAGTKIVHVSRMLAEEHYAEHRGKAFFDAIIQYIMGVSHYPDQPQKQRVIAIVYMGIDAIKKVRDIAGPTNPHQAREQRPGCIRSLGTMVPLTNEKGESTGARMDNLIHASANKVDAEREIKLWFKPEDFPPFIRAYPTKETDEHFYIRNKKLYPHHEPGSICLLAPGDFAWETDLNALQELIAGKPSPIPLESIVAKYLVNKAGDQ